MDVVAVLVLVTLAVTELVTPAEALSGFSNPAVVTVWAVLILSAGLTRTVLAGLVGRNVLSLRYLDEEERIAVRRRARSFLDGLEYHERKEL